MQHARMTTLLAIGALSLGLASCASQDSEDSSRVATVTETVHEGASTPTSTGNRTDKSEVESSSCAQVKDLRESAFGRWMRLGEVPLQSGESAPFDVADNCYNPAMELSWAVITLKGDTPGQALILLRHGDMVTEPAPVVTDSVSNVERITDEQIHATVGADDVTFSVVRGQVQASNQLQAVETLDLRGTSYRGPRG